MILLLNKIYFIFQIVRIQCPSLGTKRIDTKGNESIAEFLNKVCHFASGHLI